MLSMPEVETRPPAPALADAVTEVSLWLSMSSEEVDSLWTADLRRRTLAAIRALNTAAHERMSPSALYLQQLLLARIYKMHTTLVTGPTADRSGAIHEITLLLETATVVAEDAWLGANYLADTPSDPREYLSWLKNVARTHRVYKHAYYSEFIRHEATAADLRTYVMQESVVDGRFDDLLALMQVGTDGAAKMEIAANFWDEMGNGNESEVHTSLFNNIFDVFDISAEELESSLTANALLSGNLAVLLCRYRSFYPEAVGFLGMTEWMVPDRFVNVVHAWERLGLPEVGIVYHKLHITVDAQHAAGWFHNVVLPAASNERMRQGIARGALWRLNSSARYLDERLTSSGSTGVAL